MADTATTTSDPILDELRAWLDVNWDPDLTVAEWWERLGSSGWAAPNLPETAYGKGLSRNDGVRVARSISSYGALAAPAGLGILLAAPTIASHGTPEQIEAFVRPIVTGQKSWCQLFSEPGAGSDLAGLQTRAVRDGDEWVVTGQKVWTSGAQKANLGMLMARTNVDVPKHQGITYFAFDMEQEGAEVRPLREMTGRALFNEVFLTEARVPDAAVIGGVDNGWAVANTTLANERAGLGAGGGGAGGGAHPGTIDGVLDRKAGEFVAPPKSKAKGGAPAGDPENEETMLSALQGGLGLLLDLADRYDRRSDATVRQDLAAIYTWGELGRFNGLRLKAAREAGRDIPGMPNIAKLSMSELLRRTRDAGLRICGPAGAIHGYTREQRDLVVAATGSATLPMMTEMSLFAQAPPIYGGTDQVQRNIIGERVLGLPKEPNNDRTTPFSELPKNV